MVYCQCDFCGKVPPQMSAITDSLVTQLKLTTTLPHLSANSFADAPFATPMQTDKARETTELNASWKPQHQRPQEKLNFGIETILYGSSKSGKSSMVFYGLSLERTKGDLFSLLLSISKVQART